MSNPWDFTTPIWYERTSCSDYPAFEVCAVVGTPAIVRKPIRYARGFSIYEGQSVRVRADGAEFDTTIINGQIDLLAWRLEVTVTLLIPATDQIRGVPLVYDSITGTWSAKLSKANQEDREIGLEVARLTNEDQSFLARAGYIQ